MEVRPSGFGERRLSDFHCVLWLSGTGRYLFRGASRAVHAGCESGVECSERFCLAEASMTCTREED